MEIRKGPYGQFVTLKCDEGVMISEYAVEMIRKGITGCALPVYLNDTSFGRELAFDCTGMQTLSEADIVKDKKSFRNAIADLFKSISEMSDNLMLPGNIVWDTSWIFWDSKNKALRVCMCPFNSASDNMRISSLGDDKTQTFLSHRHFKEALTSGERDSLLFSIRDNDESLLRQSAVSIKNTSPDVRPSSSSGKSEDIYISLISAAIALVFMLLSEKFISFLFFIASSVFLITSVTKDGKKNRLAGNDEDNGKTRILFEEERKDHNSIACLILSYYAESELIRKAVYTQRATVGSDCFLSDINVEDDSVSPLHIQILRHGDSFTVTDLSQDNMTFLDGLRLDKCKEYEVRDGQKIKLGNVLFEIRLGLK